MHGKSCVACGCTIQGASGLSSLYGATDDHVLCEPCFFNEEEIQEEKGTNNIPELLMSYEEGLFTNCKL